MPDLAERLGSSLGDRYRIDRHLGTGGMASVFLAEDLRHQRPVAIKVILPRLAEAMGASRFVREIRVTASFAHPNIPPLLDSGEADGLLYYVMPYVSGATLSERIRREGRLGLAEALTLGRELADALDYAHRQGVVHRDVKPGNVFLEEGHALLGDFGVARLAEEGGEPLTSTEMVIGTAEYMSPEQCSGSHAVDNRTDVYSLGCLLYEMLAGEPPFVGRTRAAVVARQMGEPPPSLEVLRGDVPPEVSALVTRCLAKAPGDRFATAGELRDALDATLHGLGAAPRIRVPRRSRTWWTGAAGVVAMALAGVALWPRSAPAVNAARVVVFPLADRGGGGELGADVALMIGNALVHTDPLRWIDGWSRMSPEQRADPAALTHAEARAIALDRGARTFVTGGVARSGDTLSIGLVLHDAVGDSVLAQASTKGAAAQTSAERLALEAVVQLMPALLDPGRSFDLSPLSDRDPAAVALWIQGDRAYRLARFGEAFELYRRAVEADSLLVFAAVKGALAASWNERPQEAAPLVELAARHHTLMPPAYRSFTRGIRAYQAGEADSAVAWFRDALTLDPDWAEGWTALGETYQHLLPSDVEVGRSARQAFTMASDLDPHFVPPLVHLTEAALLEGDVEEGRTLLARLEGVGAEADVTGWLTLMEACAGAAVPRVRMSLPRAPTKDLLWASHQFAAGLRNPGCAEVGFRAVLAREDLARDDHWAAVVGLLGLMASQGRAAEADSLLARSLEWGEGSTRFLYGMAVAAGLDLREGARGVDAEAWGRWGPDFENVGPQTLWSLALWNALEGDVPVARTLARRLKERADAGQGLAPVLAPAARAHLLVAEGDPDAALAILRELRPAIPRDDLDFGLAEPLAPERALLAELLLAAGEPQAAFEAASRLDHPGAAMFVPFVARSLVVRVRAAEALPGRDWARRARDARARLEALGRNDLLETAGR